MKFLKTIHFDRIILPATFGGVTLASRKQKNKMPSKTAKDKAAFRRSSEWRTFRKQKMLEQKGLDPVTKRRLTSKFHCHHILQTSYIDVYKDISDSNNFVAVNAATHDALHYALHLIFYNGAEAWQRFVAEAEREALMNNYIDEDETFTKGNIGE